MSDTRMGYVSIHRSIMDHWIWRDKPVSKGQAWVDLILLANYKAEKFSYKDKVVEGKRGSVYRSITYLAERWGWGRDKATRFLRQLEGDGMIVLNITTHQTIITIVHYGDYQGNTATSAASDRQPIGDKSAAGRHQADTYNKDNNVNNDNKGNNSGGAAGVSENGQSAEEIEAANRWFESL
jgi:hypothetical protein